MGESGEQCFAEIDYRYRKLFSDQIQNSSKCKHGLLIRLNIFF